jgi:peptide/nickel transport system permease protein
MTLAEAPSGHVRRNGPTLGLILALAVLGAAALWALAPGLFTSHSPVEGIAPDKLTPPGSTYWFGTDELGRDVLTRLIHGARQTLTAATLAVGVGLTFGSLIGLLAGATGGWVEAAVMRFVDVLLSIPSLLLALALIVIMGFGNLQVALAVGATSVAGFARLIWSEVITVRRTEYVEAAFGSGGSFPAVLWRHVLPNALTAVLAYAALQFGWAILQISTLGFLGYGAPPPTPEWGLMIAEGRNYMTTSWWLTVFPGLAVILVVLAANTLGRALRRDDR